MLRQKRFKGEEAAANTDYAHVCEVDKQLFADGKRNYKKFKDLPPHAVKMPERDPLERSRNFKEVNLGYTMADALAEAERCIMCTKPTCIEGCPVGIDIPRFIRHLLVRDLDGALGVINESNLFPSVCGRVCPQESQCEAQCQVGRNKKTPMESVAIGRLERFIGDNAHGKKNVAAAARTPARQGRHRRLRAVGPGGGRGPRQVRLRGDRVRGAARGRRRPAVRHSVVPPAARDHRARGRQPEGTRRPVRDQQGGRQDLLDPAADAGAGLRRGVRRGGRRRAVVPRHPGRVRRARSIRPTSS